MARGLCAGVALLLLGLLAASSPAAEEQRLRLAGTDRAR
jgi:hypothetical protein